MIPGCSITVYSAKDLGYGKVTDWRTMQSLSTVFEPGYYHNMRELS